MKLRRKTDQHVLRDRGKWHCKWCNRNFITRRALVLIGTTLHHRRDYGLCGPVESSEGGGEVGCE